MRQLNGLPTSIAEVMMKVELGKAGIPVVQVLGAKEMAGFKSEFMGVLQFANGQIVIFNRIADAWEMRWRVLDDALSCAIDPASSSAEPPRNPLRPGENSILIRSQERLVDVVLKLVVAYGPAYSVRTLCERLDDRSLEWSSFGAAFVPENTYPHPTMELYELAVTEARTLRALGRALKSNVEVVKHDREAIGILEGAIARHGLMRRSEELTSEADAIRGALLAFCKTQTEECDRLLQSLASGDGARGKTLAELEWFLTQRVSLCSQLGRGNHASSLRKRLELIRGELFELYIVRYRSNLGQIAFEQKLRSRGTFGELDALMHDATQKRTVAILAGRLAQITRRLGLNNIADEYEKQSTRLSEELNTEDAFAVIAALRREFGTE